MSCLILVSCLFLYYPAHQEVPKSNVRIHENPMIKRSSFVKSNPNLCFTNNQSDSGLLCVDNDIFRSVSCNNILLSNDNRIAQKMEGIGIAFEL